jgi:hypothetical protein
MSALGRVELRWTCRHPRGVRAVVYTVSRRAVHGTATGPWEHLGLTGEKSFTDETLPRGGGEALSYEYQITARRGGARQGSGQSHAAICTVQIGSVSPRIRAGRAAA